jgi:hybrid cluster-associated redox disulfide protein
MMDAMEPKNNQQPIQPESLVAEVLTRWPQTIPVFTRRRMSCVGCSMSGFETLAGAAEIYHLDLREFLKERADTIA